MLNQIPNGFDYAARKAIMEKAAAPIIAAAKALAPKSKRAHSMYNTPKLTNNLRAPKGMGVISATFNPGNLSRSIKILTHGPFRKSPFTYIGPKYPTRNGGGRHVAPYAHMVEFGTIKQSAQPYMRPAFESQKNTAFQIAKKGFRDALDKELQKMGVAA